MPSRTRTALARAFGTGAQNTKADAPRKGARWIPRGLSGRLRAHPAMSNTPAPSADTPHRSPFAELCKGLFRENPTFRLVLGLCPTLAVTTSVRDGLGMGLAATFVLVGSNAAISALRHIIPDKVRIPCYIVVIASLVTVLEMLLEAWAPALHRSLGIFIPLIVVNCIILGRAEAFAARNAVIASIADGLGMGLGFTLSLTLVSFVRASLGKVALLAILPPGGFLALGCLLAAMNHVQNVRARRRGLPLPAPPALDCRSCVLCHPAPPRPAS